MSLRRYLRIHEPLPSPPPAVSDDTGLLGIPDITDVCRELIDRDLSQRPTTGNARSRWSQRHSLWSDQRAEHDNMCTGRPHGGGKLMRPDSAICAYCNELVTACWLPSVTVTCRRPIAQGSPARSPSQHLSPHAHGVRPSSRTGGPLGAVNGGALCTLAPDRRGWADSGR
jgi:hypothetical protein